LILSPTRELALQIAAEAQRLVKNVSVHGKPIEVHTAFGGTARASSLNKLKTGDPKILVATPGRLNDILGEPDVKARFAAMQTLIIDEADAMLEAGQSICAAWHWLRLNDRVLTIQQVSYRMFSAYWLLFRQRPRENGR